jgi:hypothetical protein
MTTTAKVAISGALLLLLGVLTLLPTPRESPLLHHFHAVAGTHDTPIIITGGSIFSDSFMAWTQDSTNPLVYTSPAFVNPITKIAMKNYYIGDEQGRIPVGSGQGWRIEISNQDATGTEILKAITFESIPPANTTIRATVTGQSTWQSVPADQQIRFHDGRDHCKVASGDGPCDIFVHAVVTVLDTNQQTVSQQTYTCESTVLVPIKGKCKVKLLE